MECEMAKKKFSNNFMFTQSPDNAGHPFGSFDFTQMFDLSNRSMPGANNWIFCAWFREPMPEKQIYKPHVHGDDEYIGYFGSNQKDVFDLGGEIELWIEDEPYNFTKSGIVFIPQGVAHCPWFIRKITTPIFIMFIHSGSSFEGEYFVDNPRWKHLPSTPEISEDAPLPPGLEKLGIVANPPELVSVEEHLRRQKIKKI
jgi:hypothetical protein